MKQIKYIFVLTVAATLMVGCAQKKKVASATKPAIVTTEQTTASSATTTTAATTSAAAGTAKKGQTTQATQTAQTTVTTPVTEQPTAPAVVETPKVKEETIISKALKQQPDFVSLQAQKVKFTINYSERQISSSGTITLVKDSMLIISIQPLLGIELVRAEASPSTLVLIDKMNKRYVQMDYAELQQKSGFPITFADIQAVVMDRMFVLGQDAALLTGDDAILSAAEGQTTVKLTEGKLDYTFTVDDATLSLVNTMMGFTGKTSSTTIAYSGHSNHSGVLYPSTVDVTISSKQLSGSAKISMPSVTINGIVSASHASTANLNKTTLDAVIKGK